MGQESELTDVTRSVEVRELMSLALPLRWEGAGAEEPGQFLVVDVLFRSPRIEPAMERLSPVFAAKDVVDAASEEDV